MIARVIFCILAMSIAQAFGAATVEGKKTSERPNTNVLDAAALLLIAKTNGTPTNMNMTAQEFFESGARFISAVAGTVYVRKGGSDTNGTRGRFDKPFLTVTGANAVAISGDVIDIGPGFFYEGSNTINLADNVSICGAGLDATTIGSSASIENGAGVILSPGDNSWIADLTIAGVSNAYPKQACIGADILPNYQGAATNVNVYNCRFSADSDGLYVLTTNSCQYRFFNCVFDNHWDSIAVGFVETNSEIHQMEFNNCLIMGRWPSVSQMISEPDPELQYVRVINNVAGHLKFNNCVIVSSNGPALTTVLAHNGTNGNIKTEFNNCVVTCTSTNGLIDYFTVGSGTLDLRNTRIPIDQLDGTIRSFESLAPIAALYTDSTVTNTTTDSYLFLLKCYGTQRLLSNYVGVGQTMRFRGSGYYSTASTPGTVTARVILNHGGSFDIAMLTTGAITPPAGMTQEAWELEARIVCRTNAVAGAFAGSGVLRLGNGTTWAEYKMVSTADVIVSTTTTNYIPDLKWQWSATTAPNSVTMRTGGITVE